MVTKCSNCGRTIWEQGVMSCACGKYFCCKLCSDEWHKENNIKKELNEVRNEKEMSKV